MLEFIQLMELTEIDSNGAELPESIISLIPTDDDKLKIYKKKQNQNYLLNRIKYLHSKGVVND